MGNFQNLAEKILAKNNPDSNNVSCFLPLTEETGNLQCKSGNNDRNIGHAHYENRQCLSASNEETYRETSKQQREISKETFTIPNNNKSFLSSKGTTNIRAIVLTQEISWVNTLQKIKCCRAKRSS